MEWEPVCGKKLTILGWNISSVGMTNLQPMHWIWLTKRSNPPQWIGGMELCHAAHPLYSTALCWGAWCFITPVLPLLEKESADVLEHTECRQLGSVGKRSVGGFKPAAMARSQGVACTCKRLQTPGFGERIHYILKYSNLLINLNYYTFFNRYLFSVLEWATTVVPNLLSHRPDGQSPVHLWARSREWDSGAWSRQAEGRMEAWFWPGWVGGLDPGLT